jgi:hypothetical protein
MMRSNGVLDFFHRPKNKITGIKITMFRKLVLLPSSGDMRGEGRNTYSVGSRLRLALSKGPNRVGVPPFPLFSPEDGSRTSFRNVVILTVIILFFGRWEKSKNPLLHNIIHRRQNLSELIYTTT